MLDQIRPHSLADPVFVEQLWRTVKYEEIYLRAYDSVSEARASIARYLAFYNRASEHPSVYVIELNKLCWFWFGPAGYLGFGGRVLRSIWRCPSEFGAREDPRPVAAMGGELRSRQLRPPAAAFSTQSSEACAASERLSQGSTPSAAALNTGMRWCDRNEVTRSRVQRLPLPVLRPLRLRRPAIRSSLAINANSRTASMMSAGVLLRCPRRRFGKRISLWMPPDQCTTDHDLRSRVVDIGHDFVDQGAHDALLQSRVGRRRRPDRLQIGAEEGERGRVDRRRRATRLMRGDLAFDFGDAGERLVPARLEFASHQPIGRIGGVVLPEGAVSRVSRCFKIAA